MLSLLLPDVSREQFLREHFQRAPVARASTAGKLVRKLTWATVERLIATIFAPPSAQVPR